ncbi:MAG: pyrroline-5-carboxylate reductase [Clostridia bacterium]|nr:pyrroline-5-carboxylate reductase [Clostridia bacterium]
MSKIGFIGTGHMGGALALAVGRTKHEVYLSNHSPVKAEALRQQIGANAHIIGSDEIILTCDMVFLGVKPQMLPALADELKPAISRRNTHVCFISMAAGVSVGAVETMFARESGASAAVIRIMPNTPAAVGAGMIPYCVGSEADEADIALFCEVLAGAGTLDRIPERLIDAASCVSGCGPAFAAMFIEALADGGVRCGLPRDKALLYAEETVRGTAVLAEVTGQHPGEVKDAVCSPGGTTIEGVAALERAGFRAAAMEAVTAAFRRTMELKK